MKKYQTVERGETAHEFNYYRRLGEFSLLSKGIPKKTLQSQYRELIQKRAKWGKIDAEELSEKITKYDLAAA